MDTAPAGSPLPWLEPFHNSSVVFKHQRNRRHRDIDLFATGANACHVMQRQNKWLAATLLD